MSEHFEPASSPCRERYVIGSGASVQFLADGSLSVSVSAIGKKPDANQNVIAEPNPSQALAFVEWLMDRVNIDDMDGWLKAAAERFRDRRGR